MQRSDNLHSFAGTTVSPTQPSVAAQKLPPDNAASAAFRFQHISELDGFRGFAVLVVVIGHYLEFRLPVPSPYFATLDKLGIPLPVKQAGHLDAIMLKLSKRYCEGKVWKFLLRTRRFPSRHTSRSLMDFAEYRSSRYL